MLLEINNLFFSHSPENNLFRNFNLKVEEGKTTVPYTGKIDENGLAILKREIEIKESPEEEAKKAEQQKLEEEKKSKEVYKTIDGKDFTFNQWKEYEQKAWEEYQQNRKK